MKPIHKLFSSISAEAQAHLPILNGALYTRYIPLVCGLLFASCSPLRSTRWEEGAPQPGRNAGQAYYLPKANVRIVGQETLATQNAVRTGYTLQLSTEMLPDRQHRHYAWHTGNWLYEDAVILQVNATGLLEAQQKADARDKLPDSLVSIGKSAVYAWQVYSSLTPSARIGIAEEREEKITKLRPFDISFDPTDYSGVAKARKYIADAGFVLDITPLPEEDTTDSNATAPTSPRDNGIFYRPMTTITVTIRSVTSAKTDPIFARTASFAIPNAKEIAILPVKRMPFVDMAQQGTFAGGSPTKLEITQPSPILGVVQIPEKILGAAAGAIGGVFDNRTKARTDERQRQLFDAELALAKVESEKKLAEAQLQAMQAQSALAAHQQISTIGSLHNMMGTDIRSAGADVKATTSEQLKQVKQRVEEMQKIIADLERQVEKEKAIPETGLPER